MIRGLYTGASGMTAQMQRMDALANNLANVDTTGYKRDQPVHKAFPELLLRRMNADGVIQFPLGSVDVAPVVGKLGTGVELNELYTDFTQGSLKETTNPFDLALDGKGFFSVETPRGERYTRNGSFHLGPEGLLVTKEGLPVLGENGYIRIKKNNFLIDQEGNVYQNGRFSENPQRLVSMNENEWEETELVDRLKVVDMQRTRYLKKQGSSLWRTTEESGEAENLGVPERPKVLQGFLETANVNPVTEMVQIIEVNRTYEANQRMIQTQDNLTGRLLNDVLRI